MTHRMGRLIGSSAFPPGYVHVGRFVIYSTEKLSTATIIPRFLQWHLSQRKEDVDGPFESLRQAAATVPVEMLVRHSPLCNLADRRSAFELGGLQAVERRRFIVCGSTQPTFVALSLRICRSQKQYQDTYRDSHMLHHVECHGAVWRLPRTRSQNSLI